MINIYLESSILVNYHFTEYGTSVMMKKHQGKKIMHHFSAYTRISTLRKIHVLLSVSHC